MAKITALTYQKKNPDRVNVYLDGRFALGVPDIVAARLKVGQDLSEAEVQALKQEGDVETAYGRTLDYLSYRPRSRQEVALYLQKREIAPDEVELVLERLERAGLVDDEAFAHFWVENRERFRPRGPQALRYELRQKGISERLIDEVVTQVDASDSAYRSAEKKARQWGHLDEETFRRKLVAYLTRRGFDYPVAREVTDRHWAERSAGE